MNKDRYKKIIAILFFFFFMTPILSPSIGSSTLYIHWFIPFLDIDFLKEVIATKRKKKEVIGISILILGCIILTKIKLALEIILIIESLLYIKYCYKNDNFKYLYWGMNINIVIAIVQFVIYYISPDLARAIGPSSVSKIIWGSHATASFTNMFPNEFGIVKVSGWSREAGFFNSLIIITTLVYIFVDKKTKKSKLQYILFLIGFLISLSKVSILPILIVPIIVLKKYINKIPYVIGIVIILAVGIGTSEVLRTHNQYDNAYSKYYETFTHRFSGYSVLKQLNPKDIIFGINTLEELPQEVKENSPYLQYIYRFYEFCGMPAMLIHNGLIISLLYFVILRIFNFKTSDLFIITIVTLTVNYTTQTSFVVLTYYLILSYSMIKKGSNQIEE